MNTIFILLIVMGFNSSQSGATTVQLEFNSLVACQAADQSITQDAYANAKRQDLGGFAIVTHGCHKK